MRALIQNDLWLKKLWVDVSVFALSDSERICLDMFGRKALHRMRAWCTVRCTLRNKFECCTELARKLCLMCCFLSKCC